jgi:hypothetical protein
MATAYVKHAGVWKPHTPYVRHAGVWKEPAAYVKSGGAWQQYHPAEVAPGGPVLFDAASVLGNTAGVQQLWLHTPVGIPSSVIIGVATYQGTAPVVDPTSVTYGGVAATLEGGGWSDGENIWVGLYTVVNPPPGPQNVIVNWPISTLYSSTGAITVTGGSTTDAIRPRPPGVGTAAGSGGNASTFTVTVPSSADELAVDLMWAWSGTPVAGAEQTERVAVNPYFHMSTKTSASASVDMTWNAGVENRVWALLGASFNKVGA